MKVRADELRVGHRINGSRVLWTRPLPGGKTLFIALELPDGRNAAGTAARTRFYRPDEIVEVEDPRAHRQSAATA